jgi:hypothetical protein
MDATYLSLLIFTIISILYYLFKPKLSMSELNGGSVTNTVIENGQEVQQTVDLSPEESFANFTKKSYLYLIIYVLLVIVSQFFINAGIIINKCGGNLKDNFAASALMTFIPWVFIFGSVVLILIIFPGFKSAFSNVIGYFAVSGQANEILNDLLVNADMQAAINSDNTSPEKKAELQKSAEAIIKLCGNTSIMVNQMVPENFTQYWAILQPLMKNKYQQPSEELNSLQEKLLSVVVMRDNIGEALWYFYTAILLISIVQYNLTTRGCVMDPATIAENHQKFVEQEEAQLNQPGSTQVYSG